MGRGGGRKWIRWRGGQVPESITPHTAPIPWGGALATNGASAVAGASEEEAPATPSIEVSSLIRENWASTCSS